MKPKLSQTVGRTLKKASPTILTCIGAVGVVATAVLAVKATPKALEMVRADSRKNHDGDPYAATKVEVVKSCWKCYVPAVATGAATIICIFGANTLNRRQQASLASAYALVSRQYNDYIGSSSLDFEDANEEERLFYDPISKRYFQSTISKVLQAEYHLNRNFALGGGFITLNDFYTFLGIEKIPEGDAIGWMVSDGLYWVDFNHSKAMVDDGLNGEIECYIIDVDFPPVTEEEYDPYL